MTKIEIHTDFTSVLSRCSTQLRAFLRVRPRNEVVFSLGALAMMLAFCL